MKKNNNQQTNNKKRTFSAKRNFNKDYSKPESVVQPLDYFPRNSNIEYNVLTPLKKRDLKSTMKENQEKVQKDIKTKKREEQEEEDNEGMEQLEIQAEELDQQSRCLAPKFLSGDLVLGCISEIRKDYMIANHSRNKKLFIHREFAGFSKNHKFRFEDYFKIGQFISAAVIDEKNKYSSKKKIKCSIEPHIINAGLLPDMIVDGMDLWGQVIINKDNILIPYFGIEEDERQEPVETNSKMDIDDEDIDEDEEDDENEEDKDSEGIYSEAKSDSEDEKEKKKDEYILKSVFTSQIYDLINSKKLVLKPDSFNFFKVKSINKETNDKGIKTIEIQLSLTELDAQENQLKPIKSKKLEFMSIRPGMIFKCNDTKNENLLNGLEVQFADFTGTIFEDHGPSNENKKAFNARITHVSSDKHKFALSAKDNIVYIKNRDIDQKLKLEGLVMKEDKYKISIKKKLFGDSYLVEIKNKTEQDSLAIPAFFHSTHLFAASADKYDKKKIKEALDEVPQNVKVKEFNFYDNLPFLVPLSNDNENESLNWKNIEIGQKIKATVISVHPNYIKLGVNNFINGLLYKEHLTDVFLNIKDLSKNKKFQVNSKLTVTVFDYNYSTKLLLFTLKPALEAIKSSKHIKEGDQLNFVYKGNNFFQHCGGVKGKLLNFTEINKTKIFKEGNVYPLVIYRLLNDKILLSDKNEVWHPSLTDYDKQVSISSIMTIVLSCNSYADGNSNLKSLQGKTFKCKIINAKKLIEKNDAHVSNEEYALFQKQFKIVKFELSKTTELYGFLPIELFSDTKDNSFNDIKYGAAIDCLVLYHNSKTNVFFLTSKTSLISNKDKIIYNKDEIGNQTEIYGFISKLYEDKEKETTNITFSFYGTTKQTIKNLKNSSIANYNIHLGQSVIVTRNTNGKLNFKVLLSDGSQSTWAFNSTQVTKSIPFYNIPNSWFVAGEPFDKQIIKTLPRDEVQSILNKKDRKVEVKEKKAYPMKILKKINARGLVISLYFDSKDHINAFCDITEITDLLVSNPLEHFKEGDVVLGRVLSYDNTLGKYVVSLRESLVNEADFKIINAGNTNQAAGLLNKSKIDLRNKLYKYGAQSILEKNQVVIGYVTSSSEKGVFIKLAKDCSVRANMNEISDHRSFAPHKQINENQLVLVRIISINGDKENKDSTKVKINVSLRESVVKYNLTLKLGSINNHNFYLCLITGENKEKLQQATIIGSTFNGVLDKKTNYEVNSILPLEIVNINKETFPPSKVIFSQNNITEQFDYSLLINSLTKEEEEKNKEFEIFWEEVKTINEDFKQSEIKSELKEINIISKDVNLEDNLIEDNNFEVDQSENESEEDEDAVESDEVVEDAEDADENDEESEELSDNDDNEEENDQEEDNDVENKLILNNKSSKKREKHHFTEEMLIRKTEKDILNKEKSGKETYDSIDDFEKKILTNTNSSELWINYVAFILENINYESAKKIFERAIKTIDITLLKEKLNIWVAYLNLENKYGSPVEFKSIVERAMEVNDKKQIYKHLILIYKNSGKLKLAYETYKLAVKQFGNDINFWKAYLDFVFSNKVDDGSKPKEVLSSSLQVLISKPKRIEMLIFYANCLYKYDQQEQGKTAFESLIKDNPKRGDIILVYLDKEMSNNPSQVRHLFKKFLEKDLKIKLLKPIIQKYVEFENKNGNELERAKAAEYVKKIIEEKTKKVEMDVDEEDEE